MSHSAQEKTKYKLAASMKECMLHTPVDKITVTQIAKGCGVTRQTFYRNFLDKYDLINWYFDRLVLQAFEQIGYGSTVLESLTQKFHFILSEKVFFTQAFRSHDCNSVKEHDFRLILQFYTGPDCPQVQQALKGGAAVPSGDVLPGLRVHDQQVGAGWHEGFPGGDGPQAGGRYAAKIGSGV